MKRLASAGAALALLLLPVPAVLEDAPEPEGLPASLFAPPLVLALADAAELTDEQRRSIEELVDAERGARAAAAPRKEELSAEILGLLDAPTVSEESIRPLIAAAMELERDERVEHLMTLVRVKNVLTAAQQQRLAEVRDRGAR